MSDDDIEQRVREFVRKQLGFKRKEIPDSFDVVDDASIYGDDVWELVEDFSKEFRVQVTDFRWYHHTGPEGCNPLWILFPPWWARKTHVPIRIIDLIESARSGMWTVQYPENERQV